MQKKKDEKIQLSAPWERDSNTMVSCKHTGDDLENEAAKLFIKERTRVHELYIKEQEKTKRISLILGVILILSASALFIYAPPEKENLSYIIASVLLVFAAGVVGYKRVWGKIPFSEFNADQVDNK